MDEEITKQLAQEMLELLRSTREFVLAQAPDVIQQLYRWAFVEAIIYLSMGIFLIVAGASFLIYLWKKVDDIDGLMLGTIFLGVPSVVCGSIMTIKHTFLIAQIAVAPKIFLIEYLSKMVSSK